MPHANPGPRPSKPVKPTLPGVSGPGRKPGPRASKPWKPTVVDSLCQLLTSLSRSSTGEPGPMIALRCDGDCRPDGRDA